MNAKIELYLKGGEELAPLAAEIGGIARATLPSAVTVEQVQTRSGDVVSTIVLNILGSISAHYLIEFCQKLAVRRGPKATDRLRVVISYNGDSYEIPTEIDQLLEKLRHEAQEQAKAKTL